MRPSRLQVAALVAKCGRMHVSSVFVCVGVHASVSVSTIRYVYATPIFLGFPQLSVAAPILSLISKHLYWPQNLTHSYIAHTCPWMPLIRPRIRLGSRVFVHPIPFRAYGFPTRSPFYSLGSSKTQLFFGFRVLQHPFNLWFRVFQHPAPFRASGFPTRNSP